MKKIGIICSGGDCQGMNVSIKTIVNICQISNITVIGYKYGFKGLVENDFEILTNKKVENIADQGGCYLKVSRYPDFLKPKVIDKAAERIKENNVDGIILLGGDGSYRGGLDLFKRGINIVGIPGTIDNDIFYTEKSLGFDTAVNNAVAAIDNMRQSIEANDRAFVVEVMGRKCGKIALHVAAAVFANALATLEIGTNFNSLMQDMQKNYRNGARTPLIVVSEAMDFSIDDVKKAIEKQIGIEARSSVLGYIQRGGAPSVEDRILALQFSTYSIELLKEGKGGTAVGIKNNSIFHVSLEEAVNTPSNFDMELYHQLRELHKLNG